MSRQFKFRTWDKNRKSFIGPVNLLGDQKYVVLPENWPWENYCEVVNLSTSVTTLEEATKQRNEYAREHWIVQQWTGLFDLAGREIYEGDIAYLNHYGVPEVDKQCLFTIIFEDGAFKLNPIKLGKAPNGGVSGFFWMRYIEGEDSDGNTIYRYELPPPHPVCGFKRMVVIGNIFENPELLK